jgi:DNA-binding NtrC family response regulator
MADILVVDDDQSVAKAFEHFLAFDGHACRIASDAEDAIRFIEEQRPHLVMMDVRMPGIDGLQALQQMRGRFPGICVVIMTAYGTSQTSIDAIRAGAFDYLTKPLDLDNLREVIGKALAAQHIAASVGGARVDAVSEAPPVSLVGAAPAMLDVYKLIGRLATNSVPALIVGERGTGKRLAVATIHDNSSHRDQPMVSLDCGDDSDAEVQEALYGRGAGTVELRHVDRLSAARQARLLHALIAQRTRGSGPRLTARLVATTEKDLGDESRAERFSAELCDELAVITFKMPPLRDRREDIPLLVEYFIRRFNTELDRAIRGVDDRVARMLQDHPWSGNVGELERVIKRACIVARSEVIGADDVGQSLGDSRFPAPADADAALGRAVRTALHDRLVQPEPSASVYHDVLEIVERGLVDEALTITNGNQVKAAEILGVNRATLRKKMPPDA